MFGSEGVAASDQCVWEVNWEFVAFAVEHFRKGDGHLEDGLHYVGLSPKRVPNDFFFFV